MRVLVVEDQPDIAALITELLWKLGHEIVVATSGQHALVACQQSKPQLVLMDIALPDMNGYEAARQLRSQCDLTNVQVWAVTSLPDDQNKRDEAGMVGYMQKPISVDRIQKLIGLG